jgi:hypothetical protein
MRMTLFSRLGLLSPEDGMNITNNMPALSWSSVEYNNNDANDSPVIVCKAYNMKSAMILKP